MKQSLTYIVAGAALFGLAACGNDGGEEKKAEMPAEEAVTEQTDTQESVDDVKKEVEAAAEDVKKEVEKAAEEVKKATEDATTEAEEAMKKAKEAADDNTNN